MASTQTSYLNSAVGTSPVTIVTASATSALVGMQCANITGAAITVDVYITGDVLKVVSSAASSADFVTSAAVGV